MTTVRDACLSLILSQTATVTEKNSPITTLDSSPAAPASSTHGVGFFLVGRSQAITRSEQEGEEVTPQEIDVIASNVYGILKRRLMAERERALGVY